MFVRKGHQLYDFLLGLYEQGMLKEVSISFIFKYTFFYKQLFFLNKFFLSVWSFLVVLIIPGLKLFTKLLIFFCLKIASSAYVLQKVNMCMMNTFKVT